MLPEHSLRAVLVASSLVLAAGCVTVPESEPAKAEPAPAGQAQAAPAPKPTPAPKPKQPEYSSFDRETLEKVLEEFEKRHGHHEWARRYAEKKRNGD